MLSIDLNSFVTEIKQSIIKLIDRPNQDTSVAQNNAADAANSTFIWFLDAGDK